MLDWLKTSIQFMSICFYFYRWNFMLFYLRFGIKCWYCYAIDVALDNGSFGSESPKIWMLSRLFLLKDGYNSCSSPALRVGFAPRDKLLLLLPDLATWFYYGAILSSFFFSWSSASFKCCVSVMIFCSESRSAQCIVKYVNTNTLRANSFLDSSALK